MPHALGSLVAEIARRRVARTLAGYSMAAFGILQGLDVVVSRLSLPPGWMKIAIAVSLAGLPVAAVLAWMFDITSEGVVRTRAAQEPRTATPAQIAVLVASLALAASVGWMAWRQADQAVAADPVESSLRDLLHRFRADSQEVPPWFRQRVRAHIDRLRDDPNTKAAIYPRMKRYWPMVSQTLAAHGLPEDLGYVVWVESDFRPEAVGPKPEMGRGFWGFSAAAARKYGLRVDAAFDDRVDPVLSTEAAARYLAELFAEFGTDSFMLALASYNMGENQLRRKLTALAQRPGGLRPEDRTFWHLYRLRALSEEALEYVPKVLAVAILCHDPGRYGLE